MEYKITSEQIAEAHKSACCEWKSKIESWFPEEFKNKIEAGKWYKSDSDGLWFIESVGGNLQKSYGFDYKGDWHESGIRRSSGLIKASEEEVLSNLNREAEKRGLTQNMHIWKDKDWIEPRKPHLPFKLINMWLANSDSNYIMIEGVWATPIESKKMTLS